MQNCLKCGSKTAVYDSRADEEGNLRRKRKCLKCGARHATVEMLDDLIPDHVPKEKSEPKVKKAKPQGKPRAVSQGGSKKPVRHEDDVYEDDGFDADDIGFARDISGFRGDFE